MVDKIIELENGKNYLILDRKKLDTRMFYLALRLIDNDEPSKEYLFFEEKKIDNEICLLPVEDNNIKGLLLSAFTINYVDKAYDL